MARLLWGRSGVTTEQDLAQRLLSAQRSSQLLQHSRKVSHSQCLQSEQANSCELDLQPRADGKMPQGTQVQILCTQRPGVAGSNTKQVLLCALWLSPALEHEPQTQSRRKQNKT